MVKKHIFIVSIAAVLGWLIYSFLGGIESLVPGTTTLVDISLSCVCGVIIGYLIYFISLKLDYLLPWKTQLTYRFLSGIIIHSIAVFSFSLVFVYIYKGLILNQADFFIHHQNELVKFAIIVIVLMLIYTVIYFAFYSYYSYAQLQIETVKYERKQIDLQLNALKSQLSPHFLFNSLNTISSLIYKDVRSAESFIRGLAKMYAYTLSSYHNKLTGIQEELDFLNAYLTLINTRFEDRFTCIIDIPQELKSTRIPPLTLQMLVENAVKHNQMTANNPLHVRITYDEDHIVIRNNITEPTHKINSFNIGLKNIKERYDLLSKRSISITEGAHFTVKIPVIR